MASTAIRGANAGTGVSQIQAGTISNADIHASAAIALTKLAKVPITPDGATPFTAAQSHGGFAITNVLDPVNPQDAATRGWVLAQIGGSAATTSATAKAATTANITLSATQTVDGVALSVGDVCLVKNQTTQSANELYTVASGAWTRTVGMDTWPEVPGVVVSVQQGTVNADTLWLSTADAGGTLNTTAITFVQIPGPSDIQPGAGLNRVGQALNVVATNNTITVTGSAPAGGAISVNMGVILAKSDLVVNETPTGAVNGSNTTFTALNTVAGAMLVYLNGILQDPGSGNDYTLSGSVVTMLTAPLTGDKIRLCYYKGPSIVTPA